MDVLFIIIVILLCIVNASIWIFFTNLKKKFYLIENKIGEINISKEKILTNENNIKTLLYQNDAHNKSITRIFKIETEMTQTVVDLIKLIKEFKGNKSEE